MIPILYAELEDSFTSLGLGALAEATSCIVKTKLNGTFELEMKYPVSGVRYKDLQLARIIKAVPEKGGTAQLFDIYKITRPLNGIVTVYASHVSDRKRFIPIMPFTATSVTEALQGINSHTAEYSPFTFWTDKDTIANFKVAMPVSMGQVLGGMEGSILDVYKGEYEFDNFEIKLWNHRGEDNGVTLRYGKNITSIEQEESILSTVTGICPFWQDMDGTCVTLPEATVDSEYADNYPYKRTVTMDFTMDFDEQPTEAQLRNRAQNYIRNNNIGIPDVGIDLSFEHLADYEEYASMTMIERVRLGDTVHVYFEPLRIETTARVVQTDYDVLQDRYKNVRIGSSKTSLSYTINGIKNLAADEADKRIGAVQAQLYSEIAQSVHVVDVEYYLSNSPDFTAGGEWGTEAPEWQEGKYIWTRTKYVKVDGSIYYSDEVCITGNTGAPGTPGTTYYTFVRYATDAQGSNMSTDPAGRSYIGIYTGTSSTPPVASAYTWSKYAGENGAPGAPGTPGASYYTWIKYADNAHGDGMSDYPDGKKYIGIAYNKTESTESEIATDYTWSKYVGEDGEDGVDFAWNLMRQTKDYTGWINTNNLVTFIDNEPTDIISVANGSNKWSAGEDRIMAHPYAEIRNKTVTFSFWVKGNTAQTNESYFCIDFDLYNEISASATRTKYRVIPIYFTLSTQWEQIVWTQEITDAFFTQSGSGTPAWNTCFYRVYMTNNVNNYCTNTAPYQIKEVKLEIGDLASPWAPAQSDLYGTSITDVVEHYAAGSSSTTAPTTGWKTPPDEAIPPITSTNKYLWNYETIHYSDGTWTDTSKKVIAIYTTDGQPGSPGVSVGSVVNYYLASPLASGVTKQTAGWTPTVQDVTPENKYLWNYEVVYNDKGQSAANIISQTDPCIIGAYGQQGENFVYNLLKGTTVMTRWSKTTAYCSVVEDTPCNSIYVNNGSANWSIGEGSRLLRPYSQIRNQTITLSFKVKGATSQTADTNFYYEFDLLDANNSRTKYRAKPVQFRLTTGWQRISVTENITDSYFSSGSGSPAYATCICRLLLGTFATGVCSNSAPFYIKEIKMEIGDTPTDWTPNETDNDIESVTELYYLSASTTVPAAPTSAVSVDADVTEQWTKQAPTWQKATPYYYTCSEVCHKDGRRTWSAPVANSGYSGAAEAADSAQGTADDALAQVGDLGADVEGLQGDVDDLQTQVEDIDTTLTSITAPGTGTLAQLQTDISSTSQQLDSLSANFEAFSNSALFSNFYVDSAGVHTVFTNPQTQQNGEILNNGASIQFIVDGSVQAEMSSAGFRFIFGIISQALQVGEDTDTVGGTWTWVKAESGHFRLVYKASTGGS